MPEQILPAAEFKHILSRLERLTNKSVKVFQRLAFGGGRMSEQVKIKRVPVCTFIREGRTARIGYFHSI